MKKENEEIKNQPAPFIYEKIGTKFSHFFIDEFQDVPKPIVKSIDNPLTKRLLRNGNEEISESVIDFKIPNKSKDFDKKIRELRREMEKSAKELDFKSAALYRDQIKKLKEIKSSSF